jgi:hypothetical protein
MEGTGRWLRDDSEAGKRMDRVSELSNERASQAAAYCSVSTSLAT